MYLAHTALAVGLIYNIALVTGEKEGKPNDSKENSGEKFDENTKPNVQLEPTFVALIDILYTDGSKRTCTGAIIHDNVVLTAAHCFNTGMSDVQVELTASFVVIGTKAMFETGYEQYLPIERIITHPMYKGWTADLSLVYTFAGMTSDKPATIVPLAGEKAPSQVDANVTLYSWGRAERSEPDPEIISSEEHTTEPIASKYTKKTKPTYQYSSENDCSESDEGTKTPASKVTRLDTLLRQRSLFHGSVLPSMYNQKLRNIHTTIRDQNELPKERAREEPTTKKVEMVVKTTRTTKAYKERMYTSSENTSLVVITRKLKEETINNSKLFNSSDTSEEETAEIAENTAISNVSKVTTNFVKQDDFVVLEQHPKLFSFKSYYRDWRRQIGVQSSGEVKKSKSTTKQNKKSWRRQMDQQENHLSIDNSIFVNLKTCKEIVDRMMPSEYSIMKSDDVVCYASGYRKISDEDSGAPVVWHRRLVALTVGAVDNDGEYTGIGMKMSCYCSWISDNLPAGAKKYKCCNNCCDVKHKEEIKSSKRSHRNKHFLN